jgi:hypothetical protein
MSAAALIALSSRALLHAQANPPRIEIGAVISSGKQSPFYNGDYHVGGGGRAVVNFTQYVAGQVESTRQPTGNGSEWHTALAVKATYRAEARRWLHFAGLNFFGVVGPTFLSRTVAVADPNPPPFCIRCAVWRRDTSPMYEYGGGFEVVPAPPVALRLDVTHGSFSEFRAFSPFRATESRMYLKVAMMWRLR